MIDGNPTTNRLETFMHNRRLMGALIILSAASVVVLPIFIQGFPKGSDIGFHFRWNYYFAEELRQGNLYPRWLAGGNRGYGSPVTLYYPPLQFYVTAAIDFLVHDTLRAITLACWLATALCGLTMYLFSRTILSRTLSLAASVLYMWAPYHLLDLYRGNSLSQYWSAVWIPLVLWATHRISVEPGWTAVPYLALSYGLLCLTHVPLAFATTLIIPVYAVVLTRNPRKLVRVGTGVGLGLGISAAFMSSVLFERQYVTINAALTHKYYECFLFEHLGQLRGIDLLSSADYEGLEGFLLEIDLVTVGLTLLWGLSSLILWKTRKHPETGPRRRALLVGTWTIVTLSIFLTTRASTPIWRYVPQLEYMQTPDRWLVIAVTGTCLLVAAAASTIAQSHRSRLLKGALLTAAVIVNFVIGAHITTQRRANPEGLWNRVRQMREAAQYTPIWWDREWQDEFTQSSALVRAGNSSVIVINDTGVRQEYTITGDTESVLELRTLYFPGWTARVDGKIVPIAPTESGHIRLSIPSGEHTLMLNFEDTWPRTAGKIISMLSVIASFALMYLTRRRMRPRAT
jgi:hypothetical protein